ncbi:MAG: hypothetical protein HY913_01310 [Desulfomonile tiedjei]|nr:hypothetical protein [Desulfomonile tiedjei]
METWENLSTWSLALTVVVVFLLVIWDPLHHKYQSWKLKRAFRLRDKADR